MGMAIEDLIPAGRMFLGTEPTEESSREYFEGQILTAAGRAGVFKEIRDEFCYATILYDDAKIPDDPVRSDLEYFLLATIVPPGGQTGRWYVMVEKADVPDPPMYADDSGIARIELDENEINAEDIHVSKEPKGWYWLPIERAVGHPNAEMEYIPLVHPEDFNMFWTPQNL